MKIKKDKILYGSNFRIKTYFGRGIVVIFSIFFAIILIEVFLRFYFPYGIYGENNIFYGNGKSSEVNFDGSFERHNILGENIDFWNFWKYSFHTLSTPPIHYSFEELQQISLKNYNETLFKFILPTLPVYFEEGKKNIAIIGDSVAEGHHGNMQEYRFSRVLSNLLPESRIYNFAIGGQNIAEEYVQYERFVKNYPFEVVVYVYYNNDVYYNKFIDGKLYNSPVILEGTQDNKEIGVKITGISKVDNFFSKLFISKYFYSRFFSSDLHRAGFKIFNPEGEDYLEYLQKRFLRFIQEISSDLEKKGKRFIVIISPPRHFTLDGSELPQFNRYYQEDTQIYDLLKSSGVEVYNLYDFEVQNRDFYIDNCCHLNKQGHQFYADFIKKILTSE